PDQCVIGGRGTVAGCVGGMFGLGRKRRFADRLDRERIDLVLPGRGHFKVANALGCGSFVGVGQLQNVLFRGGGLLHGRRLVHQGGRRFGRGRLGGRLGFGGAGGGRRGGGFGRRVVFGDDPADRRQDLL